MQALGKLAIVALCGVLAGGAWADEGDAPGLGQPDTQLRVLNKRKLKIPFTADNSATARAVRLYVSTDRGANWRVAAEQPVTGSELLFEGTEDGEHWFTLATVDDQFDPKNLRPQQKVVIDSVGPKIDLRASADTQGTLSGVIRLTDPSNIAWSRLLYATDIHREWRTITNQSIDAKGNFKVDIQEDWRKLSIHITATDTLGHVSVEAKTVQRPRVAALSPRTGFATHDSRDGAELQTQFADGPNHPGNLFLTQQGNPSPEGKSATTSEPAQLPPGGLPAQLTPNGIEVVPAPNPVEDIREYQDLPAPKTSVPANASEVPSKLDPNGPITPSFTPPENAASQDTLPPPAPSDTQSKTKSRTLAEALRPMQETPAGNNPVEPTIETIPTPAPTDPEQAFREQQRYRAEKAELESRAEQRKFDLAQQFRDLPVRFSNSNRFSLDYELEAVGATGVESVELYGTLDGGKTWKRWGSDPDGRSPFDIETKGEGVFGFRVVVLGNNGLASPRPLDGDQPDIVIVVDQTAPKIKITSARYGEGDRIGSLEIRYECEDEYLGSRPVSIAFSESLQGPWSTIVSGLRNDGLYVWPADSEIPRRIYLRVDATDKAGNHGKYLLDQPIETQGLAPRAKILGLRTR